MFYFNKNTQILYNNNLINIFQILKVLVQHYPIQNTNFIFWIVKSEIQIYIMNCIIQNIKFLFQIMHFKIKILYKIINVNF